MGRLDRVPGEGGRVPLRLHLDAVDGPSLPLRPADDVRVEVSVPGVGVEPDRDGGAGAVSQCLKSSPSICSPR